MLKLNFSNDLIPVVVVALLVVAGGGLAALPPELLVPLIFWRGLLAVLRL